METLDQETDSLRSLEERIHQAVQLVNRLRQEKDEDIRIGYLVEGMGWVGAAGA